MSKLTRQKVIGSPFGPAATPEAGTKEQPSAQAETAQVERTEQPVGERPVPSAPAQPGTDIEPARPVQPAVSEPASESVSVRPGPHTVAPPAGRARTADRRPARPTRESGLAVVRPVPDQRSELPAKPGSGEEASDQRVGWAWPAIQESTLSARARVRGAWPSTPVRIAVPVKDLLTQRLVDDQDRTGDYRLATNHYISAALRQLPTDVGVALDWSREYQDYLGLRQPEMVGTKMQLETPVGLAARKLRGQLRLHRHGHLSNVETWAVVRLLIDLAAADAGESETDEARLRVLQQLDEAIG
jgi:hypothetical protein